MFQRETRLEGNIVHVPMWNTLWEKMFPMFQRETRLEGKCFPFSTLKHALGTNFSMVQSETRLMDPLQCEIARKTFLLISDGSFFIQPGHSVTNVTQDWYPCDYCDTVTWAEWKNKTWWSPISAGLYVKSPCRRLFRLIHFKEIRMEAEKWVGKCISITRQGAAPPKHCPPTKLHCK